MPPMDDRDALSNFFGNDLTDGWILKSRVFLRVGNESEFQQGSRSHIVVQNEVLGEFNPTTMGTVTASYIAENISRKGS